MENTRFVCLYNPCHYESTSFHRFLIHTWDKHSLSSNFSYECLVSGCTKKYRSRQSFVRHLKNKHSWYYDAHYATPDGDNSFVVSNPNDSIEDSFDDTVNDSVINPNNIEDRFISLTKAKDMVAEILLELREKFNTTTKASNFIAEKMCILLDFDRKMLYQQVTESVEQNMNGLCFDYETSIRLQSRSIFSKAFDAFVGEKSLSNYIEAKPNYVKPIATLVHDEVSGESDTIQYVPILKTLQVLLSHEDLFELVVNSGKSSDNRMHNYCDGSLYSSNKLFEQNTQALQLILYHDDFTVVNPLGNKTIKHKMSCFYFQIGNIPPKCRSQLADIHLLIVCPATMIKSYGYRRLLRPLIDDVKILEETGIEVCLNGPTYLFLGTGSMLIADNLAALAIGGHHCNFSLVKRFCRFCQLLKANINETIHIDEFEMRTIPGYQANVADIKDNAQLKPIYGIVDDCCLNDLNNFYSINGLPQDLAHDLLEGFAKDFLQIIVIYLVESKFIKLPTLNTIISNFEFSEVDKKNPLQLIKIPHPLSDLNIRSNSL